MTQTLIVHGVGNRDEVAFRRTVRPVIEAVGGVLDVTAHPVYWGGLGPTIVDRYASVPIDTDTTLLPAVPRAAFGEGGIVGSAFLGPITRRPADLASDLADATMAHIAGVTATSGMTPGASEPVAEPLPVLTEVLEEASAAGKVLALRADLAPVLAAIVLNAPPAQSGFIGENLIDGVKGLLAQVIDVFDREAAKLVHEAATNVLREAEGALSPAVASTVGDILAYTRHGPSIRGALDLAYRKAAASGEGVDIVAHSIGALIAVEWLLGAPSTPSIGTETPPSERTCRRLITFGTQVSLFAEVAGLEGWEGFHRSSGPLTLPLPVEGWDNIWHELDPLAFVMGRALHLDPIPVHDWRLDAETLSSMAEFWEFHSSYWTDSRFLSWLTAELAGSDG